jgi:hypothetical protein
MKWALDSGYMIGTSEIGATYGGRHISILENEIGYAVEALGREPGVQFYVEPYIRKLNDILQRARETVNAGGTMTPYVREIDDVWKGLTEKLFSWHPPKPLMLHLFHSGLQLGWAYMRCSAMVVHHDDGQEDDTLRNLDAAKLNLDVVKANWSDLTVNYVSKIEEIKRQWHGALGHPPPLTGLRTVADFIESLRGDIKSQLKAP